MEKYAWRGKIVPGMQEEYKKRHDNIWPEMKEVLADAGIVNYSIWMQGEELFGYYECEKTTEEMQRIHRQSGVTEKCPFRKSVEYPFSEFVDCGVVVYYDLPLIYLSKHVLTYGQKGGNRQQHDLIKWGEDALQLSYTKKAVRAIRTYAPPELYEMLCRDIERNPYIRKKYK